MISAEELVCEICFEKIHFTHDDFNDNNLLKERCKLLFPVENAFALMQFDKESLSQKIIHNLKYGSREKIGKILAEWTSERISFENGNFVENVLGNKEVMGILKREEILDIESYRYFTKHIEDIFERF